MGDMGMGMTMMGAPTVFGTNQDSNNFLDVRNMRHSNNQGTIRVDRIFNEANTLNLRYSVSKEDGFMPQNLPGFGFNHDNAAQNGVAHLHARAVAAPGEHCLARHVAAVDVALRGEQLRNDIVGELGITGVGFGGPARLGRSLLQRSGLFAVRRLLAGHSDAGVGHGRRRRATP